MTLPSSGSISLSQVAVELGRASNATTSLGESAVRTLAGVASGAIAMSNLRGKTNGTTITVTQGTYSTGGKVSFTYNGFATTGTGAPATFGSVSPTTYKGVAIKGLYSNNVPATMLEFSGNQTGNASFLTSVTIGGTNLGTVPAGSYNSSTNVTTYSFSGQYFTSSGTKTVVLG